MFRTTVCAIHAYQLPDGYRAKTMSAHGILVWLKSSVAFLFIRGIRGLLVLHNGVVGRT